MTHIGDNSLQTQSLAALDAGHVAHLAGRGAGGADSQADT